MKIFFKFLNRKRTLIVLFLLFLGIYFIISNKKGISFLEDENPTLSYLDLVDGEKIRYEVDDTNRVDEFTSILKKYELESKAIYKEYFCGDDISLEINYVNSSFKPRHIIIFKDGSAYLYESADKGIFEIKNSKEFISEIIKWKKLLIIDELTVLDYDFYYSDYEKSLYAFLIEGEGVLKHNDLNDMDYQCGKRILVYKKYLEEKYDFKQLSNKEKRRELFAPAASIKESLADMEFVYENDFTKVNPWTISVGQLDEDEAVEFFVGAYRPTDFYKDDPRPYFLEYKDEVFVRQWTGSYLDNFGFSKAYIDDDDFDGIGDVKMKELVYENGDLVSKWSRFNIVGFQPYRCE